MAIEIKTSVLTDQVNNLGWKKNQLAEHYGLPMSQMTQVLKDAGLKIRKFHAPKYQLVDDTIVDTIEKVGEDINVLDEGTEQASPVTSTDEVSEEREVKANW